MLGTVAFVLGGAVTIALVNIVVSPILHMVGKGEEDKYLSGVSQIAMLALTMVGIYAVLNGVWDMCGMSTPGYFDKLYQPGGLDSLFGRVK
jgi:hypothetical protein